MESILESCAVKALRDRLRSEMTLHEQTRTRAKELERRLLQATKREGREGREGKSRFGVTSPTPYAAKPEKPREKRSVVLPPLISPKPQPRAPQRPQGGPLAGVQDMLKDERMMSLSREEQSRTRVQAFRELGRVGLSTWDVRMGEKVSRFQDMRAFSDSMWNSFYDWNSQYQSVG
ncbi:unnamed protein product [Effrenium voratum]|nr:unnamed protein product [Effrenium voratum]